MVGNLLFVVCAGPQGRGGVSSAVFTHPSSPAELLDCPVCASQKSLELGRRRRQRLHDYCTNIHLSIYFPVAPVITL